MNRQHQDDDEAVLARIMADGTFDSLRHKLLDELRNDPDLQQFVEEQIRKSSRLEKAAYDGADEKELFEELRHDSELERAVTEVMLRKVWQSTSSEGSAVAAAITASAHETLCAIYEEREHGSQQRSLSQGQPRQ